MSHRQRPGLRVVEIKISPLRERPEDLEPLVRHFLAELREKIPARARGFTPAALRCRAPTRSPGTSASSAT